MRHGGFSSFSEKVNGRLAQLAFPLALAATGDGDLLTQLADHPVMFVCVRVRVHVRVRVRVRVCARVRVRVRVRVCVCGIFATKLRFLSLFFAIFVY